jgi:hypothetical protein
MSITVFLDVTPRGLVEVYRHFGGMYIASVLRIENGSGMFHRNFGQLLQGYTGITSWKTVLLICSLVHHIYRLCGSVGIETSYGLETAGFDSRQGKIFLFFIASGPAFGSTQPPIQWVTRPGREADHSPLPSTEVKNGGFTQPQSHIFS